MSNALKVGLVETALVTMLVPGVIGALTVSIGVVCMLIALFVPGAELSATTPKYMLAGVAAAGAEALLFHWQGKLEASRLAR